MENFNLKKYLAGSKLLKESIDDNLFKDINVKFKKLKRYSLNRGTVERWADEYYTDSLPKTFGDEELEDLQSYLDRKYKLQGRVLGVPAVSGFIFDSRS